MSGLVGTEKLEIINISKSDMSNNSIQIFKQFTNLKYLSLESVKDFKLDDLAFLQENKNLLKVDITNNKLPIVELNNLLKCNCSKNIDVDIINEKEKKIKNGHLKIVDNNVVLKIPVSEVEYIFKHIYVSRLDKIEIVISEFEDNSSYINLLECSKKEVNIYLNDFSCLDIKQAEMIRDNLKVKNLLIGKGNTAEEYSIDTYIDVYQEIDDIINNISKHISQPEKFLEIYKFLGQKFEVVEDDSDADFENKKCTAFQISKLLQNSLQCLKIKSNMIKGYDIENERDHCWNQVNLDEKWYNVDLALDIQNIKKNKTEYCLLGDKNFFETHTPKSGKNNYCQEDFNMKLINVFFKTGLFREHLFGSYIEMIIEKIKKLLNHNGKREVLMLPSGKEEE